MKALLACCLTGLLLMPMVAIASTPADASPFSKRCGWFDNPTPGNISLYDRDAAWLIGEQGGYQLEQDWDWPDFSDAQWVMTNGHYGYGCACLTLSVDTNSKQVLAIKAAKVRPLAACRQDKSLKQWRTLFP